MRQARSGWALLGALAGMGVWALCFVVLYGGLSLGCTYGFSGARLGPFNAITLLLLLAWAAHAALLGWMTWRAGSRWRAARRSEGQAPYESDRKVPFILHLNWILQLLALLALLPLALPLLMLSPCA